MLSGRLKDLQRFMTSNQCWVDTAKMPRSLFCCLLFFFFFLHSYNLWFMNKEGSGPVPFTRLLYLLLDFCSGCLCRPATGWLSHSPPNLTLALRLRDSWFSSCVFCLCFFVFSFLTWVQPVGVCLQGGLSAWVSSGSRVSSSRVEYTSVSVKLV